MRKAVGAEIVFVLDESAVDEPGPEMIGPRFSFCPRAENGTPAARKSLDMQRSELDSLAIRRWITRRVPVGNYPAILP